MEIIQVGQKEFKRLRQYGIEVTDITGQTYVVIGDVLFLGVITNQDQIDKEKENNEKQSD
jgi:hypothetical protein